MTSQRPYRVLEKLSLARMRRPVDFRVLDRRRGVPRLAVIRVVALVTNLAPFLLFFAEHGVEVMAAGRLLDGLLFLIDTV